MNKITVIVTVSFLIAPVSIAMGQSPKHSFQLRAENIGGAISMTGGGTYDAQTGFLQGGGSFRCTRDIAQGPLAGLNAGQGGRWEAAEVLATSGFKCVGPDPLKTAVTDDDTLVLVVRFYRQGDGANPSFTASVFVSAVDEDPDQPGTQNVWIQQVGCDDANANVR
jgi:hypothetical protein